MRLRHLFTPLFIFLVILLIGGAFLYRSERERERKKQEQLAAKAEDVKVTLIEGWTLKEIGEALAVKGLTSQEAFVGAAAKFDLSAHPVVAQSKPKNASLEGYLFPDTYRFAPAGTADDLIKKLLDNFTIRLKSVGLTSGEGRHVIPGYEDLTLSGKRGLSLFELLTLASIVEKESGSASEMPTIAGIFYNRLDSGQALESDATINYVTGKNDPGVSAQDLGVNSPYNTYKYAGLPPGPIANPSLASIQAVLKPARTEYRYFFHKQPSGEVVYSKTFEEHRKKRFEN